MGKFIRIGKIRIPIRYSMPTSYSDHYTKTSCLLTKAIASNNLPRVKFLIEQGTIVTSEHITRSIKFEPIHLYLRNKSSFNYNLYTHNIRFLLKKWSEQ